MSNLKSDSTRCSLSHSAPAVLLWVVLAAVFLVEILGLTLRFDTQVLAGSTGWWAVLDQSPLGLRLFITIVIATMVFSAPKFGRVGWTELAFALKCERRSWYWIFGHVIVFAVFYRLTRVILEEGGLHSQVPSAWVLSWLVLGGLVATTLALAALPALRWIRLAGRIWPSFVLGIGTGMMAFGAGLFTGRLWDPLGQWTLWTVNSLLRLLQRDIVCEPNSFLVGTQSFAVQIEPVCCGYEGIGLTLAFVSCYLALFRRDLRFPHALLLLPLGAILIWFANACRITALILIGTWWSPAVALGGFHSQAGWLAFNAVAVGSLFLAHRTRLFCLTSPCSGAIAPSSRSSTAYLFPMLVLVTISMATAAFANGFDWLYPARVIVTAGVLWYFRYDYPQMEWSWVAIGIGAAVFGVWLAMTPAASDEGLPKAFTALPTYLASLWIVFRVIGASIVVPLAEELAFRGYLTRRLIASRFDSLPMGQFTWLSFIGSSVLFGAMHGENWLAGTVAGAAFAIALYRRRQLSDAILAHGTTNALLALYVLLSNKWSFWR